MIRYSHTKILRNTYDNDDLLFTMQVHGSHTRAENVYTCSNTASSYTLALTGYSNLFIGSTLNALDLYMKYTTEAVRLCMYIVWFTSVLILPHIQEV